MKKLAIILLFFTNAAIGQNKLNSILKRQLDSVMILDQKYRDTIMFLLNPVKRDAIAKRLSLTTQKINGYYTDLQYRTDSANIIFIEKILKKYGYPGKSLVGEPANDAAWNVIQHSEKIHKYIGLIKKAAKKSELPFRLYAMMLDRDLMEHGKEQIYGSQLRSQKLKNGKNSFFVWPIKNALSVNERRKEGGFNTTVEQNAKKFNVTYRIVKMDEIK